MLCVLSAVPALTVSASGLWDVDLWKIVGQPRFHVLRGSGPSSSSQLGCSTSLFLAENMWQNSESSLIFLSPIYSNLNRCRGTRFIHSCRDFAFENSSVPDRRSRPLIRPYILHPRNIQHRKNCTYHLDGIEVVVESWFVVSSLLRFSSMSWNRCAFLSESSASLAWISHDRSDQRSWRWDSTIP